MEQKLASWLCLSALLARTQHVGFTARPRALVVVVGANLIYHDTTRRRCISHELLSSLLTHIPVICIKIACAQLQPAGDGRRGADSSCCAHILRQSCIVVGRHF